MYLGRKICTLIYYPKISMKYAAVEGGGTTWVAVIAEDSPDNIVERADFKTELPAETLGKIRAWLSQRSFDAIGIATFGPVDAVESSPTYGYITSTPKPNWENTGRTLHLLLLLLLLLPLHHTTSYLLHLWFLLSCVQMCWAS